MKINRTLFLVLIFCLLLVPYAAQQKTGGAIEIEEIKPADVADYQGWQKFQLRLFSFYTPLGFKGGSKKSIDTAVWKFTDDNSVLTIYQGIYAPAPSVVDKNLPNFHQKFWVRDESNTRIYIRVWSYENEAGDDKFVKAARFTFNGLKGAAVTFYFTSKDLTSSAQAEKIFRSAKFNLVKKTDNLINDPF